MSVRKRLLIILLFIDVGTFAQRETNQQQEVQMLADHVFNLSEVMLHDVVAAPVAARFYAYAMLGAYQVAHYGTGKLPSIFFFSSRRRHTRFDCDWSSDVCSSDLLRLGRDEGKPAGHPAGRSEVHRLQDLPAPARLQAAGHRGHAGTRHRRGADARILLDRKSLV